MNRTDMLLLEYLEKIREDLDDYLSTRLKHQIERKSEDKSFITSQGMRE